MNLSPRNKLIALAVAVVLVVVVLVAVLVLPQFGRLKDLSAQIDQANTEAAAAKTLLEQRLQVKNQAAVTGNALLQLANAIPENPELPSLIIELQDAAYASGVSMRNVTPLPPVQNEGETFVSVGLGMQVWGTWSDTVDFLGRLRSLGREVRVQRFESGVLGEGDGEIAGIKMPPYYQIRTDISVMTYVIPAGSAGATATPAPVPAPPAE